MSIEHIPAPAPSDRVTLTRKTRAWERESCCAVCGEPVTLTTLHMARVLPFDDGDRVAHGACVAFRAGPQARRGSFVNRWRGGT